MPDPTRDGTAATGSALLPVILLLLLFSATAVGAALVVRIEVTVAERYRQSAEAFYAAQAGLDAAIAELRRFPDWSAVVRGEQRSLLSQGEFVGRKTVPGGGVVHVCCDAGSVFEQLAAEDGASPIPVRRLLGWRPFLWTTFEALAPREPPSRLYLVVVVSDDEEDLQRGEGERNRIVRVRSEATDPSGVRRVVQALIARPAADEPAPAPSIGVLRWEEKR